MYNYTLMGTEKWLSWAWPECSQGLYEEITAWDDKVCQDLVEWDALHKHYQEPSVIDVNLLWDPGDMDAPAPRLNNTDNRLLHMHWLELHQRFYSHYHLIKKKPIPQPNKDILLRRKASFCNDLKKLMLRPEERSQHAFWEQLHMPFMELFTPHEFYQFSQKSEAKRS